MEGGQVTDVAEHGFDAGGVGVTVEEVNEMNKKGFQFWGVAPAHLKNVPAGWPGPRYERPL